MCFMRTHDVLLSFLSSGLEVLRHEIPGEYVDIFCEIAVSGEGQGRRRKKGQRLM